MKQFYKIAFVVCLSFLYCCLPLKAQCQYGFPYNRYGGYWQPQYNQPSPYFSNRIWTNHFTAYNPYQTQMAFLNPGPARQSPFFQQNNPYQIGPYGNMNSNFGSPRVVSAYSSGNNIYNSSYYGDYYGYGLPDDSYDGPSTYFHLLPPNFMQNDPYTLAQLAKRALNED